MDELLGFLFDRLNGDLQLTDLYRKAGGAAGGRLVIAPHQRTAASYPRVVLSGEEGRGQSFSEDEGPVLLDGHITFEILTRRDDNTCPKPLDTLRRLQRRLMALLLGDDRQGIEPVKGQIVFNPEDAPDADGNGGDPNAYRWNVMQLKQTAGRILPTTSPDFVRHETVFQVGLYRLRD